VLSEVLDIRIIEAFSKCYYEPFVLLSTTAGLASVNVIHTGDEIRVIEVFVESSLFRKRDS
jgi:hypothetical protein